jgi:hypothetical protein
MPSGAKVLAFPASIPQVSSNLRIAQDTRRKQGLVALLEALLKLQQAANLQRALKCGAGRLVSQPVVCWAV